MKKISVVIFLLLMSLSGILMAQTQLYVDYAKGDDSNEGTKSNPLKTLVGARDKVREIKAGGLPAGGVVVNFRGGSYPVISTCLFNNQDSGEPGSPVVYTGFEDEKVIFDGNTNLDNSAFELAGSVDAFKLHANAGGNIYVQKITDSRLISTLKSSPQMSMDGKLMVRSRFPNIGFATVNNSTTNYSIESINTSGSMTNPVGPSFKLFDDIDASKWTSEINRTQNVLASGYLSADWLKESSRISNVSGDGTIRLTNGTKYGLEGRGGPVRMYAYNILCELDSPGEWYFDATDNKLYIWPYSPITEESKIGVATGAGFVYASDAQYINFERMTVQNIIKSKENGAAIHFQSGNNYKVAGVTFRNMALIVACSFRDDVFNSIMLSCDFFDNGNCTTLYGGSYSSTGEIVEGNNSIENCHFTQVYSKDLYGKVCGMKGVHNTFKNNLIHNINGQPVTHAGIDHIIELNEAFNVGIEEGDGGAFYTGADLMSYGNRIRYNFVHHIMNIPKMFGRMAFYSDDFDGGEYYHENVFYKGGYESIKMNKGSGHTVSKNIILDGHIGIHNYNPGSYDYNVAKEYINSTNGKDPNSTSKENYIGRMLQNAGVPGWQDGLSESNWYSRIEPFWLNRYGYFRLTMNAYYSQKKLNVQQCRYYDNLFWGNTSNISGGAGTIQRSVTLPDLSVFENPENLNFKFKNPSAYLPKIPFEDIGLYLDEYRCAVPNKDDYRRAITQHFEHLDCYTSDAYDPNTINDRLYYNTGKMVMATVPCSDVYKETEFYFDLGTTTSAVFPKYERLSDKTVPGLYGWTDTSNLMTVDNGTGSNVNDLNRDMIYSSSPATFEVKVPRGTYKVLITFGDAKVVHDNMMVKAQGEVVLSNINTQTGNKFFNKIFYPVVNDGKLTLEFSDEGGEDPNWAATRIIITKESDNTTSEEYATSCDYYEWNGNTYTTSGDYQYQSPNDIGGTNMATLHLTINTTPTATATYSSQTVCSESSFEMVFGSDVEQTTFSWIRDQSNVISGLDVSGTGEVSGILVNDTPDPVDVTFTITPTANECVGSPITSTITVNPLTKITVNPFDDEVDALVQADFGVEATGIDPITYQWQESADGIQFNSIIDGYEYTGSSTSALTLPAVSIRKNGYQYRCEVTGSCGTIVSSAAVLTVNKRSALTDYTGPEFVSVPCDNCATALVTLSASVRDVSLEDPGLQYASGDIRLARVKFVNLDDNTDISGWLTPGLVNPLDITAGVVNYNWTVSIPNDGYDVYSIGVEVDGEGEYIGSDETVLSISRSTLDEFITGGGNVLAQNSTGIYTSEAGTKVNFGFNVKYNKSGANIKGKMNVIFRNGDRIYQIKSTALSSLSVNSANPSAQEAVFSSRANLLDITDPDMPVAIFGGLSLQVTLSDNGESGKDDQIGISLFDGNTLVYSSNWLNTGTQDLTLSGGNLVVHSGSSLKSASINEFESDQLGIDAEVVTVEVYPNPTKSTCNLILENFQMGDAQIRVTDVSGKLVLSDVINVIGSDQTKEINLTGCTPGLYLISVIQGDLVFDVKVIKE